MGGRDRGDTDYAEVEKLSIHFNKDLIWFNILTF